MIIKSFPALLKEEYLMDLYDFLSEKLATEVSFEGVLSYLYSQIDNLRASLQDNQRFKARDNKDLTSKVVIELQKQRPGFPLYKIMDDLPFTDENSVVPSLTFKSHVKKLFPYVDE